MQGIQGCGEYCRPSKADLPDEQLHSKSKSEGPNVQGPPNLWQRTFWPVSRIKTKKIKNLSRQPNNMQINLSIIYSIWPPLFLIICFSLPSKALHEAHRTSWGIKAHLAFRFSRKSWEVRQALLSRMNHTKKFKGFRSGLLEGQSSLLMNAGM